MNQTVKIKLTFLFDEYSNFYQPYIPPVIDKLKIQKTFGVSIYTYKDTEVKNVQVLPSYYKRKIIEKANKLFKKNRKKLNFEEMMFLQKKIDIVHIQHSYLFPKILGLLSLEKNRRPKIIITLRGGDTYVKPWVQKKWADFYMNYGNKVDAFITMSEHQKHYLHTKWGIDKGRIHVIPISFGERFHIEPKYPNSKQLKLVSIFRMCWEKNITDNLRLVKNIKEKGIPVSYDVYGDGPDMGQLYYLRDKFNLSNEVNILGKVSNKALKEKLRDYDYILQLSHSEALPTSILEAQAYGVPAIVSNSDGIPETILNGESGFIVDENIGFSLNKIINLWNSPYEYVKFSKKAIDNSHSRFSIQNEVEKLTTLYYNLL